MGKRSLIGSVLFILTTTLCWGQVDPLPSNQWVELCRDDVGARRGSAVRYVPDEEAFFLWGYMNADPELLQEHPLMEIPEYDVVFFRPGEGRWQNHLPREWEDLWKQRLPLAYVPRTYAGITTGSERSKLRGPTESMGAPRPDLNIVFDQVVYHPPTHSLVYFMPGLTAIYDVAERRWSDLFPRNSPPPVVGGSMVYDPHNDEILLFGGGHVVEEAPDGSLVGYTGCWRFSFGDFDWKRLESSELPPPRMNTRMVYDDQNRQVVLFGGDSQSHYLADTWTYEVKTRRWSQVSVKGAPAARAGHFSVYDPKTGWVIIGGGYNRVDLTDMWAFDVASQIWQRLPGEVPTGFYLTGDIKPEDSLIVLVANSKTPGDSTGCNELFPVRTTYGYRIEESSIVADSVSVSPVMPISKKEKLPPPTLETEILKQKQSERLKSLPTNRWVLMEDSGAVASRTWGSAAFDSDRGMVLYWGGGHCGYGGNDTDLYDVGRGVWLNPDPAPEFPERLWNMGNGSRLGGLTFQGRPWVIHGRRIFAYDPVSRQMILTRPIRLTTGYDPEPLLDFPARIVAFEDALVKPPSSYVRYATWTFDPDSGEWKLLCKAPVGLDILVSTDRGVLAIDTNWRTRLNDAGYNRPWHDRMKPVMNHVYQLDVEAKAWKRLSESQPSPQNLYEMTTLVYDSKRHQLILHGGGKRRDELWTFSLEDRRWSNMRPRVINPQGELPPVCTREGVYLPDEDIVLICGRAPSRGGTPPAWAYSVADNTWTQLSLPAIQGMRPYGHNRGLLYDAANGLVWLVVGTGGEEGKAYVYVLKYDHEAAVLGSGSGVGPR